MSEQDKKLLTRAELAREFDVSEKTVSRKVKDGSIVQAGETPKGKPLFDPEQASSHLLNAALNNRNIGALKSGDDDLVDQLLENDLEDSPDKEDVDIWLKGLFGSDFKYLDDQKKLARARVVREARLAALADIDVRKAVGALIERETVSDELITIAAELTSIMHSWPARLSPELSAMTAQHEIKQYLIEEVNLLIERMKTRLKEV